MIATIFAMVLGYSSTASYAQPVVEGGGGGRWFTGSPSDAYDCSVCHAGGEPLDLDIAGLPLDGWIPGQTYELAIRWAGAETAPHVSLLAEFVRIDGSRIGEAELAPEDSLTPEERCTSGVRAAKVQEVDPDRQIISLDDCGAEWLRVQWTAPPRDEEGGRQAGDGGRQAGDSEAWLFVAGVHADASEDPLGDGVMIERIRLPGPLHAAGSDGCALVGETLELPAVLALSCIFAFALVHRRRRWAALVPLTLLVAACARVQPHERGRLAGPDMQMELDPELCAGRNHAVEYREGSAGGMGGGGGGCGCN